MSDPATSPHPTDQDRESARVRTVIAARQKTEFDECQRLADVALGPGYTPWMKLSLMDSDHRQTSKREPIATVYKVYRGEARLTENSVFLRRTPDGQMLRADNYEALFGDLLHLCRVEDYEGLAPISCYECPKSSGFHCITGLENDLD